MTNGNDKPRNGNPPTATNTRQRSIAHPRFNMKQAEDFARIVYKEGARLCDVDAIAKKAKFSGARNGSFVALRSTATQFGMVTGDSHTVSVTEEWIELFLHENTAALRVARQQAMYKPDLYKQILEDYANRQLPSVEKLAQQLFLNSKYGIIREASSVAAKVFFESASYAGVTNEKNFIQPSSPPESDPVHTVPHRVDVDEDDPDEQPSRQGKGQTGRDRGNVVSASEDDLSGLFKSAIPLENDTVVYIYAPRRLTRSDKHRLKQYIDLMLDEPTVGRENNDRAPSTSDESDDE
jgi:hypothetical protein